MPQSPLLTYDMWHFGLSKDKDSDFGEDDSSGVRMQPDHFPNVARPGGGYHKDTIVNSEKPEVFCNKCDDELVDGSCVRCDWGEQNRAVPMPNYPLDPFRDDKAGIRAGSWKFAKTVEWSAEFIDENGNKTGETNQEAFERMGMLSGSNWMSDGAIARIFEVSRPAISAKFKKMQQGGYVRATGHGKSFWNGAYTDQTGNQTGETNQEAFERLGQLNGDDWMSDKEIGEIFGIGQAMASRKFKNLKNYERARETHRGSGLWDVPFIDKNGDQTGETNQEAFERMGQLTGNDYLTDQQIADIFGVSRPAISNKFKALKDYPRAAGKGEGFWNSLFIDENGNPTEETNLEVLKRLGQLEGKDYMTDEQIGQIFGKWGTSIEKVLKNIKGYQRSKDRQTKDPERSQFLRERLKRWQDIYKIKNNKRKVDQLIKKFIEFKSNNLENKDLFNWNELYELFDVDSVENYIKRGAARASFRRLIKSLYPEIADENMKSWFVARTPSDKNYVYFIQSGTTAKIGWSGHLKDRMDVHEKGGEEREKSKDPEINQIIYNLETGRKNDVPGAIIVGPVKDEQIARITEKQIKNWFSSMGWDSISKEEQSDGFTETFKITVPQEVKNPLLDKTNPAARFTPDAMALVMNMLIKHIMENEGVITPLEESQQKYIAEIFGFDQDMLTELFKSKFGKTLGFDYSMQTIQNYKWEDDLATREAILEEEGRMPVDFEETGFIPDPIQIGENLEEPAQPVETPLQGDLSYQHPTSPYAETVNEVGRQQEIANMLANGLAHQDEQGNIVDLKTNEIIQKTTSLWSGF